MVAIYVSSWGEAAGKSTLCCGIAQHFREKGKRVGFFKPLRSTSGTFDPDMAFAREVFQLQEDISVLSPFSFSPPNSPAALVQKKDFPLQLQDSFSRIASGKDMILIEGLGNLDREDSWAQADYQCASALKAQVVVTVRYSPQLRWEKIIHSSRYFGLPLMGIVVNLVPQRKVEQETGRIKVLLERHGIPLLGLFPEERLLLTTTVNKIAEYLHGEVLHSNGEAGEELIETVMLGVLSVDCGLDYFGRYPNKVVVVRGDRPDLQLAALATPTRALILTENVAPIDYVRHWAEEKKVPLLLVKQNTFAVVTDIEQALSKVRFRQKKKLETLRQMLNRYLDWSKLYEGAGLAP